jgi:hypothetical protein
MSTDSLYLLCLGLFWSVAVLSGILLVGALHQGDKAQAWIWSALCAASALVGAFLQGLV